MASECVACPPSDRVAAAQVIRHVDQRRRGEQDGKHARDNSLAQASCEVKSCSQVKSSQDKPLAGFPKFKASVEDDKSQALGFPDLGLLEFNAPKIENHPDTSDVMANCVRPNFNYELGIPSEIKFQANQLPTGMAATLPVFTYQQLQAFNQPTLKNKARNLVDKIGAEALPPLNVNSEEGLIAYIMDVQISMCASAFGKVLTPQNFGAPADFGSADDKGYFGGDGTLAMNVKNYMEADYRKPMHMIQPAHRGLSKEESAQVNLDEANAAFERTRARNRGSVMLG